MHTMTATMTRKVFQRIYHAANMARQIADFAGTLMWIINSLRSIIIMFLAACVAYFR